MKKQTAHRKPKQPKPPKRPIHASIEAHLHWLDCELDKIIMTVADLKAVVDKIAADVAALQAVPPVVQNVEQADLDAAVTSLQASDAALEAKLAPAS